MSLHPPYVTDFAETEALYALLNGDPAKAARAIVTLLHSERAELIGHLDTLRLMLEKMYPDDAVPLPAERPVKSAHPLPVGSRVYHYGQQWAAAREGTATVLAVEGPDRDGEWDYLVRAGAEFSRRIGPDNPENRKTRWSSRTTIPAHAAPGRESGRTPEGTL